MPPQLAALICAIFILYLFRLDLKKKIDGVSRAIWIPLIWMFITGSRFVSHWLNLGSPVMSAEAYLKGSPVDRAIFLILIFSSVVILVRRRLNWSELFTQNAWIWLLFIFGAISFFWSDYPFVSFKRWIKTLGVVSMALVILTEERPYEAIGVILRRLAFLMLPLSVLFIKYYPNLGRAYHVTGTAMFTGVACQKNGLGQICLLSGIYFCWELLLNRREEIESGRRLHYSIYLILLPMIAWLLYMANSATSLACMVVAICLLLVGRLPAVSREPRRILILCVACVVLFGIMEFFFDVKDTTITMLGRRPDLTTRVPMWEDLLTMVKNPIVGYGWKSFWLGARQEILYERWGVQNTHNGYLETYLNLGLVGLFFLVGWILLGLRKVSRHLVTDYPAALLRLCFIVVVVLYNWTETTFYGIGNMWMIFILGTIEVPGNTRLNNSCNGRV